MWHFVDSGKKSPQKNMDADAKMLAELDPAGPKILHFYDWDVPSFTHGYFVDPKDFLNLHALASLGVQWARRPTGGGIVFHTTDLAFSVLIPSQSSWFSDSTLSNYKVINDKVILAVKQFIQEQGLELLPHDPQGLDVPSSQFCMAKPTIYDVMLEGKKIAGAAQRKQKQGFLHQGSIALALPPLEFLNAALLPGTRVLEGMQRHTYPLLKESLMESTLCDARIKLKQRLKQVFLED